MIAIIIGNMKKKKKKKKKKKLDLIAMLRVTNTFFFRLMMCGKKSNAIANDSGDPRKKYGVLLKVFGLLGLYKMIQMLFIGTIQMKTYKHTSSKLVRNMQKPQTTK